MNFIACFLWVGKHVGIQAMVTVLSLERVATVNIWLANRSVLTDFTNLGVAV